MHAWRDLLNAISRRVTVSDLFAAFAYENVERVVGHFSGLGLHFEHTIQGARRKSNHDMKEYPKKVRENDRYLPHRRNPADGTLPIARPTRKLRSFLKQKQLFLPGAFFQNCRFVNNVALRQAGSGEDQTFMHI